MTDDLVKRLRDLVGQHIGDADIDDELSDAADRIEELEAALRHCINALREYEIRDDRTRGPISNDDLRSWLLGAMDNARKALEGKDD